MIPPMLVHPNFDPVAIAIGPVKVHWYGLMYLIAFALGWWLGRVRARDAWRGWSRDDVGDVLFWVALGVVVGGRLGYVFFYDLERTIASPLSVFAVWRGGMSFHGGLIGVLVAMWWFARARGRGFFDVAGLHRTARAAGDRGGPPWELHQREAVGNAVGSSLGDGLS